MRFNYIFTSPTVRAVTVCWFFVLDMIQSFIHSEISLIPDRVSSEKNPEQ